MRPGELFRTVRKFKLFGTVPTPAQFERNADFQQWRGMQARKYAKWYCAALELCGPLHSL